MIKHIKIDGDIDERLKEFNARIPDGYKIKSIVPNEDYLFITLEKKDEQKERNMLLEHLAVMRRPQK